MEAPPPYMQPKKKTNTGLIVGLVIGGIVLCCIGPIALFGGGLFFVFNKSKGIVECQYAFRDIRDALAAYARDNGQKLPPVSNWQDDVRPYYQKIIDSTTQKDRKVIGIMPATGLWGCDNGSGGTTGIAYNDEVAGQELSKIEGSDAVVLFEIQSAMQNAHQKYNKQSFESGPKIMGSPRGWFKIRMTGEPTLEGKGGEVPMATAPGKG